MTARLFVVTFTSPRQTLASRNLGSLDRHLTWSIAGCLASETEVEVFEAFQVWLYTRKLIKNNVSTKVYPEYYHLIKLWLFGDKYQIPLLQNRTMDAILDKVDQDKETPIHVLHLAYENTTSNSPLPLRKAVATMILAYRGKMSVDSNGETCLVSESWPLQACLDTIDTSTREPQVCLRLQGNHTKQE